MGDSGRIGSPKPMADPRIAAVPQRHGLTLATHNIWEFAGMEVALFDPLWTAWPTRRAVVPCYVGVCADSRDGGQWHQRCIVWSGMCGSAPKTLENWTLDA